MPDEDFFEDEELVATAPSQRNWLGIMLALLVIAFIFSMIALSAVLMMSKEKRLPVTGRRFTLDDIVGNDFRVPPFNGSWLSGEELVYRDMSGGLTILNCKTMKTRLLMSNITFRQWDVHHYSVSPDQNYVLLEHDFRPVYRHSSLARYTVFDVIRGNPLALTATPDDRGHPVLSWAQWVPTDSADPGRGNALIMLYRGDIYFKQSALSDIVDRVTDTGLPGVITNGQPDWLYEEEILESSSALWFSRDGSKLVYASFNDSAVEAVPLVNYQISPQSTHLDPGVTWVRYPKAGSVNPTVTLWVVNLYSLKSPPRQDLKPPSELLNKDYYFTGVTWVGAEMVAVAWMNRLQNTSYITECPIRLGYCSETHVEEQREGWLEVQPAPVYSSRGGSYLTLLPVRDAAVGTFRHISRYDVNPSRMTPLTIGPLQVTRILAWDERLHHIYFQAVRDSLPGDRHLYRINSSDAIYKAKPECITCRANTSRHHCNYTTTTLSPELGFYVLECLGPGVPWIRLFSLPSNEFRANLTDHPELRHLTAQMAFPRIEFRSVRLNDNTNASVKLLLPPGLSIYDATTYPIILHVYGGPGTQQVTSRWRVDWGTYMASGQDFVYAWIDGSGSGNHGNALKHSVYGRLGSLEVQDQLRVLEELVEQEYFLDRRRVIIWGWSYGGYAAAMALAQDSRQLLRGAISVAPVTDWQLYDSAYTERYMGMPGPQGNYRGYEEADLTSRTGQLAGRKLLLVHGAADDNVHLQHSMVLSRALVQSGVNFQQQIFADENHSLSGVKRYLYQRMEDFINQCFLPTSEVIDKALVKFFKNRKQTQ